jgi:hypothetical protein
LPDLIVLRGFGVQPAAPWKFALTWSFGDVNAHRERIDNFCSQFLSMATEYRSLEIARATG